MLQCGGWGVERGSIADLSLPFPNVCSYQWTTAAAVIDCKMLGEIATQSRCHICSSKVNGKTLEGTCPSTPYLVKPMVFTTFHCTFDCFVPDQEPGFFFTCLWKIWGRSAGVTSFPLHFPLFSNAIRNIRKMLFGMWRPFAPDSLNTPFHLSPGIFSMLLPQNCDEFQLGIWEMLLDRHW